jgi:hypothetical protein
MLLVHSCQVIVGFYLRIRQGMLNVAIYLLYMHQPVIEFDVALP